MLWCFGDDYSSKPGISYEESEHGQPSTGFCCPELCRREEQPYIPNYPPIIFTTAEQPSTSAHQPMTAVWQSTADLSAPVAASRRHIHPEMTPSYYTKDSPPPSLTIRTPPAAVEHAPYLQHPAATPQQQLSSQESTTRQQPPALGIQTATQRNGPKQNAAFASQLRIHYRKMQAEYPENLEAVERRLEPYHYIIADLMKPATTQRLKKNHRETVVNPQYGASNSPYLTTPPHFMIHELPAETPKPPPETRSYNTTTPPYPTTLPPTAASPYHPRVTPPRNPITPPYLTAVQTSPVSPLQSTGASPREFAIPPYPPNRGMSEANPQHHTVTPLRIIKAPPCPLKVSVVNPQRPKSSPPRTALSHNKPSERSIAMSGHGRAASQPHIEGPQYPLTPELSEPSTQMLDSKEIPPPEPPVPLYDSKGVPVPAGCRLLDRQAIAQGLELMAEYLHRSNRDLSIIAIDGAVSTLFLRSWPTTTAVGALGVNLTSDQRAMLSHAAIYAKRRSSVPFGDGWFNGQGVRWVTLDVARLINDLTIHQNDIVFRAAGLTVFAPRWSYAFMVCADRLSNKIGRPYDMGDAVVYLHRFIEGHQHRPVAVGEIMKWSAMYHLDVSLGMVGVIRAQYLGHYKMVGISD